jgi:hypothetical protein
VQKEIVPRRNEFVAEALPGFQVCTNGLKCSHSLKCHGAVLRLKENPAEHLVLHKKICIDVIDAKLTKTTYTP